MKRPDLEQYGRVTSEPYSDDESRIFPVWSLVVMLCVFMLVVALLFPGPDEQAAVKRQQCEMWQIWHADRRAGVPIEQRYGWPDQAGRFYKECDQ